MTNEDRAISISIDNKKTYINPYVNETKENCGKFFLTSQEECRKSAFEMAEWKDQQYADIIKEECNTSYESGLAEGERKAEARFREYLEKKKHLYDVIHDSGRFYIEEIINELFGEIEQDNSDNDE